MESKSRAALVLLFPLLLGMRDPFIPPDDPCRTAQLSRWQYAGSVDSGQRQIAFLRDEKGKWRRIQREDVLMSGWRITEITTQSLTMETGEACEPLQWRIIKGEIEHDKKDKPAGAVTAAAAGRQ